MQHHIPLAERMRPRSFSDVAGQSHLLGEGMPLAQVFATGRLHSMVLWGPPGVGKTTLARLIAQRADLPFVALSAVLAGVKDIRDTVAQAQAVWNSPLAALNHAPQPTVVFVDEVHRFNKSQQDAFLPFVESGLFIFIGATTENPSFEVNSALLSRAAVYMLKPLEAAECATLLHRAVAQVAPHISLSEQAQTLVIASADGDARKLLNHLEAVLDLAVTPQTALAENPEPVTIKAEQVAKVLSQNMRRFDKGGDAFYDQISALHKSVRGSDPDAALYWMCRMLDGGADGNYVSRRLVRMASEDIGLADPRALEICTNAAAAYDRLGSPEGELCLAQAVVYLAVAAKSNAVYVAYKAARKAVAEQGSLPVPEHLRNAPTKLMKELGYGKAYRYAHNESDGYAAGETYFPVGMANPRWYAPVPRGMEVKIAEKMLFLRGLDEKQNMGK